MFSLMQKAHGMPKVPNSSQKAHGQVIWSTAQYDINDIEDNKLVKNFYFFNFALQMCVNIWFYNCLIFYFEFYRKFNLSETGS